MGSTEGRDGLMGVPPSWRLKTAEPIAILGRLHRHRGLGPVCGARAAGHRGQGCRPDVERPTGRGRPELLGQEPAVGHEGVGVGPAHGVEDLVHRGGEQVELVDEDHQRGLAPVDGAVVGELARQPEVAAHRLGEVVGRGGHHRVRLGAAGAEAGAAWGWCRARPGRRGGPGRRPAPAPRRRRPSTRPGPGRRAGPRSSGTEGTTNRSSRSGVLTAAEEAAEEPTRHVLTMPEQACSAPSTCGATEVQGPVATRSSWRSTRSRYARDLPTSVSRVPIVAAMVSSACTLKVSMASIVA